MSTRTVCIPVTADDHVGHSWGKATTVAIATVDDGVLTDWRREPVEWNVSHDEGTPGSHHARVARFIQDNGVTTVVADHMGDPMLNMLTKLGVDVRLGAAGDARVIATSA